MLIRPAPPDPSATGRAQLSDLVWKLHDKGLDFRVISRRPDGLWEQDVYLTTADKTLAELTKWPINPDFVDKWKGTVAVIHRGPEGLGDDCFTYGEFVFVGDRDFIEKIRQCLIDELGTWERSHN